jgi:hypothetical protein
MTFEFDAGYGSSSSDESFSQETSVFDDTVRVDHLRAGKPIRLLLAAIRHG